MQEALITVTNGHNPYIHVRHYELAGLIAALQARMDRQAGR